MLRLLQGVAEDGDEAHGSAEFPGCPVTRRHEEDIDEDGQWLPGSHSDYSGRDKYARCEVKVPESEEADDDTRDEKTYQLDHVRASLSHPIHLNPIKPFPPTSGHFISQL